MKYLAPDHRRAEFFESNRLVPGWRPVGGSGLSGSFMSGWNRLFCVGFRTKICRRKWNAFQRLVQGCVPAYLEKCCCSVTICCPPCWDVAPSLLFTPRCCLTSSCRLWLSWISVVVGVAAGRPENCPVHPPCCNPSEGLQRHNICSQFFFFTGLDWVKITH